MKALHCVLALALVVPAAAQEREIRSAQLPPDVEWDMLRMFDMAARMDGPAALDADQLVDGDLAVYGGSLRLAGEVLGDLAVVNGDVLLAPGSVVRGSITVVGGEVRLEGDAEVGGTITAYALGRNWEERLGDHEDEDRDRRRRGRWWQRDRREYWGDGRAHFNIRFGSGYNRVEGLPIQFGPTLQTTGPSPLRLRAVGIWRSEYGGFDTDRMGYEVEAEQFLGSRALSFGGSVYSVVEPLERWRIGDTEAALAAALFHDDYRDYYDRTGWAAFVRVQPVPWLETRFEYRQEEHAAVPAGDPWSLFDGGEPWRYQPLVGEGDIELVTGSVVLDLRDDPRDPYRGWLARLEATQPLAGDLARPVVSSGPGLANLSLSSQALDTDFTSVYVDLRRYAPLDYNSQLNVRFAAGGGLTETRLPPQFQHALGGIGTLPGFPTFYADCGARRSIGQRGGQSFYPAYGCDRFALGQIEYRGDFALSFGWSDPGHDEDWWDDVVVDFDPSWVVFFDAGQGWAYEDGWGAVDTGLLYDAGVGLLLDDLGVYMALPLNGDVEQEPRFFLRLGRRF